jgi:hypothetical protein
LRERKGLLEQWIDLDHFDRAQWLQLDAVIAAVERAQR